MSENKKSLEKHRKNALHIASQILSGELGIIAGSRAMHEPLDALGLRMKDEFTIFIVVDDDTDHLPIGEEARSLWHKDALPQKDAVGGKGARRLSSLRGSGYLEKDDRYFSSLKDDGHLSNRYV